MPKVQGFLPAMKGISIRVCNIVCMEWFNLHNSLMATYNMCIGLNAPKFGILHSCCNTKSWNCRIAGVSSAWDLSGLSSTGHKAPVVKPSDHSWICAVNWKLFSLMPITKFHQLKLLILSFKHFVSCCQHMTLSQWKYFHGNIHCKMRVGTYVLTRSHNVEWKTSATASHLAMTHLDLWDNTNYAQQCHANDAISATKQSLVNWLVWLTFHQLVHAHGTARKDEN